MKSGIDLRPDDFFFVVLPSDARKQTIGQFYLYDWVSGNVKVKFSLSN